MQGIPTFGNIIGARNAAPQPLNISECDCDCNKSCPEPMNNSAVITNLKNIAHLSAGAAQASLDAISNKTATPTADRAGATANQGIAIWKAIVGDLFKAKIIADRSIASMKVLREQAEKAAAGYSKAINHQREMEPVVPSVQHILNTGGAGRYGPR